MVARAAVARHTFATLTGRRATRSHPQTWARKAALDQAFYFRNHGLHAELQRCADRLSDVVERHRAAGPVVLAPLHMVSDVLAVAVCAMLPERRVSVAAVYAAGSLGPDEQAGMDACGFAIDRLDVRDATAMRAALPGVLRAVRRGERHLAIFPDILTEFTTAATGRAMRTKSARLFDRNACLHRGLDDVAGTLKATALVFHLVEHDGALDIRVHAVPPAETETGVPRIIEAAIRAHPESWLLWHYGSAFYHHAGTA